MCFVLLPSVSTNSPLPFSPLPSLPSSLRDFQAGAFQLQEATGLASLAVHDCTKLTDTALRTLLALEGPAAGGELGQTLAAVAGVLGCKARRRMFVLRTLLALEGPAAGGECSQCWQGRPLAAS